MFEGRKAERHLELMNAADRFAIEAERATVFSHQRAYAARYRGWIGVEPDRRHHLRDALQKRVEAKEKSQETVQSIIDQINRA